jgi:4a-hydroxytetrahydrobiopterin dehydratase
MARKKLTAAEIENSLADLKDWTTEDTNLKKRFEFKNFAESLAFVNRVGTIAERHDHHPDITFGWGYAAFSITTHDAGGITALDFELAKEINAIAEIGDAKTFPINGERSIRLVYRTLVAACQKSSGQNCRHRKHCGIRP